MPFQSTYQDLLDLQAVSGNACEALLNTMVNGPHREHTFTSVIMKALNPYLVFNVGKKSMDKIDTLFTPDELPEPLDWLELLGQLKDRQLTGNNALKAIQAWRLKHPEEGNREVLRRILLKDLRCGVSSKTVEKVFPGLVPIYDCMLAHKYSTDRIEKLTSQLREETKNPNAVVELVAEPKFDGVRVNVWDCDQTKSRNGKPLPASHYLARLLDDELKEWVLDSEVVTGHFQDTVGAVKKKNVDAADAVLMCFDLVPKKNFLNQETYQLKLLDRRRILREAIERIGNPKIILAEQKLMHSHEDVMAYYQECRDRGLEGLIVKPTHFPYEFKRSYGWLKIKDLNTVDLEVIRLEDGEDGKAYEGIVGSLICNYKGKEVRVSSGLSMEQRRHWKLYPGEIVGLVVELEYHEETRDGALRHGRFIKVRFDKDIEDGPGV